MVVVFLGALFLAAEVRAPPRPADDAPALYFAAAFSAGACLAGVFLGAAFSAGALLAGVFLADAFLAGAFLAGRFRG